MRCGDLDARDRREVAHRVGDYGRRDGGRHQYDLEPFGRKDFRGGEGEFIRAVPRVAPDHDVRSAEASFFEHLCHAPRGAQHDGQIHRVGTAAQLTAQPGRAEPQRLAEPAVEFVGAAGGEFRGGLRVGIVGDPLGG